MRALIRLKIEQLEEQSKAYFVATSDDLHGLVAEADTLEEVIKVAEDVAHVLLELEKKSSSVVLERNAMPQSFEYPLIVEV